MSEDFEFEKRETPNMQMFKIKRAISQSVGFAFDEFLDDLNDKENKMPYKKFESAMAKWFHSPEKLRAFTRALVWMREHPQYETKIGEKKVVLEIGPDNRAWRMLFESELVTQVNQRILSTQDPVVIMAWSLGTKTYEDNWQSRVIDLKEHYGL